MKLRIMLFAVFMLFAVSAVTIAQDDAKPASTEAKPESTEAKPESTEAKPESTEAKPESAGAKWSESQKFSYILGTQIGTYSKNNELEVDVELFARGLHDMVTGGELALSESEINVFMAAQQNKLREKAQAAIKAMGDINAKNGQAFLDANKEKEGVKVTESGLQYKVITEGNGAQPVATDKVKVHYSGTLIDGKEFDSSYKRNQPAEFRLNQVIKGWTEGLQLMSVGAKYEFYIPSALAYGLNAPPAIGPNQTLIFTVELLDIISL